MKPNLNELYQQLHPVLERLEAERQQLMRSFWRNLGIAGAIGLGVGALFTYYYGGVCLGLTLFALLAIALGFYSSAHHQWRSNFKQFVLAPLIEKVNPSLKYHPNRFIPETEYRLSMLFHNERDPDRYEGEDCIEGVVDKTDIRLSELHTQYREVTYDSKGRRHERWVTIFRGLFISADFHKHFQGITLVLPDLEERALGRLGQWLQSLSAKVGNQPGELIKMEDPEFERLFKVFSTDPIEARYILTPNLMARILEFQKRIQQPLRFSFIAERMYIAIPTAHNHLEPPSLFAPAGKMLQQETLAKYLRELEFILGVVDEMNLNTRIWTKR